MRIINVVRIENGVVNDIESFGVFEEQLVDDVVEVAEKDFLNKAKELGANIEDEDVEEELLDDGYYEKNDCSVCISWSSIE